MIKQRWLINATLLIGICILWVFIFLTPKSVEIEVPPLTTISPTQVQQIRIERTDKELIELTKKQGEHWYVTKPFDLPANTFKIQQLLDLLTTRDYQEITEKTLPLADINLDVPLAKVHIDTLIFAFGAAPVFDNTRRYVQLAQKIYLIENNLYSTLMSDPLAFVSLTPLGDNPKIKALKLPDYYFHLLAGGAWDITTPLNNIDKRPDTVNRLIEDWQNLQAFEVQNYVEGTQAGEIVSVTLAEQTQPWTFHVLTQHPNFILARPEKGIQYLFPINQLDKLLHLPAKENSTP